ncbi:MAG TPA: MAPEG family protein [Candidatus Binatia bacterium]|jgi:hypothetical protein
MPDASSNQVLFPLFAMFALTAVVFMRLGRARFGAVRSGQIDPRFYSLYQGGEEPDHIRVVTRHFINLFEMPVLFYVIVILTYVTHQSNAWMIGCAWAYVALRYAHSYVHLTSNTVLMRFRLYFASNAVLSLLWASLFVRLVSS